MLAQAQHCSFADNTAIQDQVCDDLVLQVRDHELRKKLFTVTDLTLAKALEAAREHETTEQHALGMQAAIPGSAGSVNAIAEQRTEKKYLTLDRRDLSCFNYSQEGHHGKDSSCPAKGKKCTRCGKLGHFAVKCRSSNQESVQTKNTHACQAARHIKSLATRHNDSDDDEYSVCIACDQQTIPVRVGGVQTTALVDSGATCSLLGRSELNKLTTQGLLIERTD